MGAQWPHELPQARAVGPVPFRSRLRAIWAYYDVEIVSTAITALAMAVTIAVALSACGFAKDVGGEVGGNVAEVLACPIGLFDCGKVFMCDTPAENELGLVEICVDHDDHPEDLDAVEAKYGACVPTPRHQGLCKFCCDDDCGRGANAFSGTWCMGHE
jgi:hypothetical protein